MLIEYYISGSANYLVKSAKLKEYKISECSWGTDEHDAFVKVIEKLEKRFELETAYLKAFCKVKETGRTRLRKYETPAPFFENNDAAYVNVRIGEFWVRFSYAETKEELIEYGEQFKQYVDEFPFTEASVVKLWGKYLQQKSLLEAGRIKSITLDLREGMASGLTTTQKLEHYAMKAAEFLRMRGFRVTEKDRNQFEVASSDWHEYYFNGETWTTSALGLILYWESKAPKLNAFFENKNTSAISESVLAYLGQKNNIQEHLSILKNAGLTPFVQKEDMSVHSIYVIKEESELAKQALKKAHTPLEEDYLGQLEFEW